MSRRPLGRRACARSSPGKPRGGSALVRGRRGSRPRAPVRRALPSRRRRGGGGGRGDARTGARCPHRDQRGLRGPSIRDRARPGARPRGTRDPGWRQPPPRAPGARARERGPGVRRRRSRPGRDLRDFLRDPYSDGSPRLSDALGRDWADRLGHDAGRVRPPARPRPHIRAPPRQRARVERVHGGRLRQQARHRQVHGDRGPPRADDGTAGQALPHARGHVPVRGQPARSHLHPEGRGQEGRHLDRALPDGRGCRGRLSDAGRRRIPGRRPLPLPKRPPGGDECARQRRSGPPRGRPPASPSAPGPSSR